MHNILFLEQFSEIGGGQKVLLNILDGLDRDQSTPYVAIPGKGELSHELDRRKIKYFILPIGKYSAGSKTFLDIINYLLRFLFLIPACLKIIKSNKIDLVYANAPRTFFWGTFTAKIAKVPAVWHLHLIFSKRRAKTCLPFLRQNVKKLLVVSKAVAQPFIAQDPDLAAKIKVFYNAVDIKSFPRVLESDGKRVMIGYIGRLAAMKGVESFIKAAQLVLETKEVSFLIAGDVLFGDQNYREHLEKLAAKNKQIEFLGKKEDLLEVLSDINILVVPSIEPDACPLVLLEGMAAGKAVIGSNIGGIPEIIRNGENGLLFPPGDVKALSERILDLIAYPERIKSLGQRARADAEKLFSLEKYQKQINDVIQESL